MRSGRALGAVVRVLREITFELKGKWREADPSANLSAIAARHRANHALWLKDPTVYGAHICKTGNLEDSNFVLFDHYLLLRFCCLCLLH
jgi:hypothetical protein